MSIQNPGRLGDLWSNVASEEPVPSVRSNADSSGGLSISKRRKVVVIGENHEYRTGFAITSNNDNFLSKSRTLVRLATYFVIHIEGHPAPPNPTGDLPLRIRSPANWLPVSAMDTENVIAFRPPRSTRVLRRCHVRDLQAAMDQKTQRDRNEITTLANAL